MSRTVLVVDDQVGARSALAAELEDIGLTVIQASNGLEGWECFCAERPDLVVTDMVMPRSDGLELLSRVRARSEVPVILFTAYGSVETAVSALKSGADEFVSSSDLEIEGLVDLVREVLSRTRAPEPLPELERRIQGGSGQIRRVREQISALAPLRTPVLIRGEPGTGRDTVARALHELGSTAGGAWSQIDATSSDDRGSRIPDSGALYLDGVEHLPSSDQAAWGLRLARAERSGFRGGARILASTSELGLGERGHRGFHPELATMLTRFQIQLPRLRERAEDIPELVETLAERLGRAIGRAPTRFSPDAIEYLTQQRWPGNVGQLKRVLERAIAFSRSREIRRHWIEQVLAELDESVTSIRERQRTLEREALLEALHETGGNITRTAERLGRSRAGVYRLIEKHGIRLTRDS